MAYMTSTVRVKKMSLPEKKLITTRWDMDR